MLSKSRSNFTIPYLNPHVEDKAIEDAKAVIGK
jgi:hypothetical protein